MMAEHLANLGGRKIQTITEGTKNRLNINFVRRTYCEQGTNGVRFFHCSYLEPGDRKTAVGWLIRLRNGAYTPPESSVIRSARYGSVGPAFG
jgi:hypothetical protein